MDLRGREETGGIEVNPAVHRKGDLSANKFNIFYPSDATGL